MNEKEKNESMSELERTEGNYYKMDLFVSSSLVLFTIWVFFTKEIICWAGLLGVLAVLFLIRGIFNWKKRNKGVKKPPGN